MAAFLVLAGGVAAPAFAQPLVVADSGDSAWIILSAIIALSGILASIGLYVRETGTSLAVALAAAIATLVFVAIGYSLAFGSGSPWLGGPGNAMLANLSDVREPLTVPESAYVLYELGVVLAAVTLVTTSLGNRARGAWLVPFVGLWVLIVMVPIARWVWLGWLAQLGTIDFAGGIVVLLPAGVASFVLSLLLRRPAESTAPTSHMPQLAMALAWMAIIGGAAMGAGDYAAAALINALVAVASGALTGSVFTISRSTTHREPAVLLGTAAALAAISAGAGFVGPLGAILLGAAGAGVACLTSRVSRRRRAAAPALLAATVVGNIGFPLFILPALGGPGFEEPNGLITQLAAQGVAVIAVTLWSAVATVIAALMVSVVAPMRTADEAVSPPS